MLKAKKVEVEKDLREKFSRAKGIVACDYRGMPVADLTELRFELKKSQTDLQVVKNRIALRAMDAKDYGDFKKSFDYMTAIAMTYGDPAAAAKTLTKFAETHQQLKIRSGYVEGKVISLAEVKALSKLPSRQELLGKFLGTLNAVPTGFVRVLNGVPSKWVYLLEALRKSKEGK